MKQCLINLNGRDQEADSDRNELEMTNTSYTSTLRPRLNRLRRG